VGGRFESVFGPTNAADGKGNPYVDSAITSDCDGEEHVTTGLCVKEDEDH